MTVGHVCTGQLSSFLDVDEMNGQEDRYSLLVTVSYYELREKTV